MAMEPVTIFSRIADPAMVARGLRENVPGISIDGPDHSWHNAVISFGSGRKKRTLTLTHDPDYYAEPNWSRQMEGMREYFSRFPESDRKPRVIMLTSTFKFSLGALFEPDYDPAGDERLGIVCALTELLDGVIFSPSVLRDANGGIILSAGGEEDEDADVRWPLTGMEIPLAHPLHAGMHEPSRPEDGDDIDEELDPPSPERVARRAIALAAVTFRGILEQEVDESDSDETRQRLLTWVRDVGIDDEFEPEERELVYCPLGELNPQDQTNAAWRLEGLVVLAWALRRHEIPPHDVVVDCNSLWQCLGIWKPSEALELLRNPSLRDRAEIGTLRERLFAIHWRFRNYSLNHSIMDFADFAKTCWFGPLDISSLPLTEGDIAVSGKRIDKADPELLQRANSSALERHQAVNWLWDGPEIYSDADTST